MKISNIPKKKLVLPVVILIVGSVIYACKRESHPLENEVAGLWGCASDVYYYQDSPSYNIMVQIMRTGDNTARLEMVQNELALHSNRGMIDRYDYNSGSIFSYGKITKNTSLCESEENSSKKSCRDLRWKIDSTQGKNYVVQDANKGSMANEDIKLFSINFEYSKNNMLRVIRDKKNRVEAIIKCSKLK